MQWWLAERGATVISVDRGRCRGLKPEMWERFRVKGRRVRDSVDLYLRPPTGASNDPASLVRRARAALWRRRVVGRLARQGHGRVVFYNADVARLDDVADASVDAVVSISALEHNAPERLPQCLAELVRVLKPGGPLVATISAARDADWYHEPSSGWCYTEQSIRKLFGLADCPSNFDRYDEMLGELRGCDELRRNLGELYFRSGNNGMPWGVWDPRYVPVGIVKVKTAGGAGQPGKP
jgi:SAM-dependent methyltransferase